MSFSKSQKLKLGIIKSWPLANKLRLAKFFLPSIKKNGDPLFKGISILNKDLLLETTTSNYLEYSVFATGAYEPEIVSVINSQLYSGQNAIDIGANVGIHTLTMSKRVGAEGQVIAFEPVKFLRNKLTNNLKINNINNVTLVPFALSDRNETVKVNFDPQGSNLGTTSLGNSTEDGNEEIDVKVGDELIEQYNLKSIDLIKIDVEGFELKVLQGLSRTLDNYKPRIIFEYDRNYIERINSGDEDINDLLFKYFEAKGYRLYLIQLQGIHLLKSTNDLPSSGNLLAMP